MCVGGNGFCQCHLNSLQGTQQSKFGLGIMQSMLGHYSALSPYSRGVESEMQDIAKKYFGEGNYKDFFIADSKNVFKLSPESKMNITGKEYLVVNSAGNVLHSNKDLDAAKKAAGEHAHSTQGTVYIFRPVLEIAPKRDVVETSITLA